MSILLLFARSNHSYSNDFINFTATMVTLNTSIANDDKIQNDSIIYIHIEK